MTRKIVIPGLGEVEIQLDPSEYATSGKVFVKKMSEKFFVIRHRPYEDPSDVTLINAVQQVESIIRNDILRQRDLDEKRKTVREGAPVVGHIGS